MLVRRDAIPAWNFCLGMTDSSTSRVIVFPVKGLDEGLPGEKSSWWIVEGRRASKDETLSVRWEGLLEGGRVHT